MTLAAGTHLGRYEIRSPIGAGGMGEVYLARDPQLERTVALKILPARLAADSQHLHRFLQEARAASKLKCANVAHIYEIGEESGQHFIAMEYVEGQPLDQRINGQPQSAGDITSIGIQIARALEEAHAKGVTHRDIKPQNIIVTPDMEVKVLDFGLAKLDSMAGAAGEKKTPESELATWVKTSPGVVMGSVSYMSPEQAMGREVDHRTDLFSLGVVLYEMATGRLPFTGASVAETIHRIAHAQPEAMARFNYDVPPELEVIVKKALRKNRDERYQTANELFVDLKNLHRELDVASHLEHSAPQSSSSEAIVISGSEPAIPTNDLRGTNTVQKATLSTNISSARYIVSEFRRYKPAALAIIAMLFAASTAAFAYFFYNGSHSQKISSVAVLPFTNTGGDPNMEYLSDGISESLINSLSQLPQLKVVARSSSFKFKGKDADPQEAAKALGVEAILTGRVTQRDDHLLISVDLMDARDKTQVWGEQYNRKAEGLLAVQAEISREIAARLRMRLTEGKQQQLAKSETANSQAYELLLKGRFLWRKGGTENQKKAVEYYQQAITVDPAYAPAYAELSASYSNLVVNSVLDPKEFTPQAERAVLKALELDETLADAHLALANLKLNAWDWAAAEREYKRAIELNPNLAEAYRWYANYLGAIQRHDEALVEIKRARELDPISLPANADVGFTLYLARHYDQAIESLQKTLELDRSYPITHGYLGYTYTAKGRYAKAIAAYQEAIRYGQDGSSTQIYLGAAYARAGEHDRAQAILKRLQASKEYVSPAELAALYAALDERDQALAALERGYAAHDLQLQYLKVDPFYDDLRADPRYQDLIRKVGLPQ